jgi:hypothetical protein
LKIVEESFELNGRTMTAYDLNKLRHPWSKNKSLIACYYLCKNPEIHINKLSIEEEISDLGMPIPWNVQYTSDEFDKEGLNLEQFLRKYDQPDFWNWYLIAEYQGVRVTFGGFKESTIIKCACAKDKNIDFAPLLTRIERVANN